MPHTWLINNRKSKPRPSLELRTGMLGLMIVVQAPSMVDLTGFEPVISGVKTDEVAVTSTDPFTPTARFLLNKTTLVSNCMREN